MESSKLKHIIFLRSIPVAPYPRLEKAAEALYKTKKYKITVLAWDREGGHKKIEKKPYGIIKRFKLIASYGRWKFFAKLFIWQVYEFFWLLFHKYDAIHAFGLDTYWPAILVAKIRRKKIIYDIHDFYADMISDSAPKWMLKIIKNFDLWLIGFADATIIADDSRKEQIQGSKPKKLIVTYNAPDINPGKISAKPRSKKTTIFYGGLMAKQRGLSEMIEAIKNNKNYEFVIGGFGPDEEYYKKEIKNYSNIKFLGKLDYDDLLGFTKSADILFATYDPKILNHKYSSPNKLFEAMALEKPIIVSNDSSMAKIVKKEKCGLIIKYGDILEIRKTLEKLRKNSNLRKKLGQNGKKAYLNKYHWDIMAEKIRKFYQELF